MYGRARHVVEVHQPHPLLQLVQALVDHGLHTLRLGDGQAAQWVGGARNRLARDR